MEQKSAWMNAAAKAVGTGLSLVLLVALTRAMTPAAFADFAVVLAWVVLATVLAGSSLPMIALRFVAENLARGRPDLARGAATFALAATTFGALLLAAAAALAVATGLVTLPRDLDTTALVAAALLPPGVVLLVLVGILQGLKRVTAAEVLSNVLRPALVLAGLGAVALARGLPLASPVVLEIYLGATLAAVAACALFTAAAIPGEMSRARAAYTPRVWIGTSFAFLAVMLAAAVNERIDLLMMGALGQPADVAKYAVAARFAQTVIATVNASAAVMAPRLVERLPQLEAGERSEVRQLVRATARTMFTISLLALAGLATLGPWLLRLFGPHYQGAIVPLLVLVGGQAVAGVFGPAGSVATFAGRSRLAVASLVAGIATNATLNLALVPMFAALGAAIATGASMIVASALAWALARRALQLDTSVFAHVAAQAVRADRSPQRAPPGPTP